MINKFWNRLKNKSLQVDGFTILETVLAMTIFTVGITAAIYMQTVGITAHTRSRDHVEKTHAAVMQGELLRSAVVFDDLVDDGGNSTPGDADPYGGADLPTGEDDARFTNATFTVRQDAVVRGIKMVYMSNRLKAGTKAFTLNIARPSFSANQN